MGVTVSLWEVGKRDRHRKSKRTMSGAQAKEKIPKHTVVHHEDTVIILLPEAQPASQGKGTAQKSMLVPSALGDVDINVSVSSEGRSHRGVGPSTNSMNPRTTQGESQNREKGVVAHHKLSRFFKDW